MLTDKDIRFIKSVREEIRTNRTREITVRGTNFVGEDPMTGEKVDEPFEEEIGAVVTEVSVRTSVDRYLDAGIEIRTGDIIVDISIGDLPEEITSESIEDLDYDGKTYVVIASDKLGLGDYNRVEVIGRREK